VWDFAFGERGLPLDLNVGSSLALKLKSLGAQVDDLDFLLRAVKRRIHIAAYGDVIRQTEAVGQLTVLLAGTTCSYRTKEDGGRRILSFQHAGDFCDLHRYLLPDADHAIGVQALTDSTVAVIDCGDMDGLLSRPTLASALWRASMLEAAIYRARLTSIGRQSALQRVAHLLCEQLARREAVGLPARRLPLSQIDIADATGLSVMYVNREIQMLRSLNVLSGTCHAIEVIDKTQLAKIAEFDGRYLSLPELSSKWTVQVE
jgi:CRP-like cAMP-binding protein